jgi:hypothetical protein
MKKDVVFLVADKDMEQTLIGMLSQPRRLGIRDISFDIFIHPLRDPGCWNEADQFLRSYTNQYHHALVLFDYQGSGQEAKTLAELESELENRLSRTGWDDRARAIILDPELEIWVWSNSPVVERCLGWEQASPALRVWLVEQQLLEPSQSKPADPKRAVEQALRRANKARSASIYKRLAEQVSLNRCTDLSFLRFKSILQQRFPLI